MEKYQALINSSAFVMFMMKIIWDMLTEGRRADKESVNDLKDSNLKLTLAITELKVEIKYIRKDMAEIHELRRDLTNLGTKVRVLEAQVETVSTST